MSTVAALRATLGLDGSAFRQGLNAAKGNASTFSTQVQKLIAPIAAAIGVAFSGAAIRSQMDYIDAQAKMAQSLGTTSASLQVLERAGELAGVSLGSVEQSSKDLQRRLSQAAAGGGPVADALKKIHLSARDLIGLPLDERVSAINGALEEFVPAAQRAAIAGQLFGEEGSLLMTRLDPKIIAQAAAEIDRLGYSISEVDAGKIEQANDAISSLGLIGDGLVSQITVAVAPALNAMAQGLAAVMAQGGPVREAISFIGENLGRLATYAAAAGIAFGVQYFTGMVIAIGGTMGLTGALAVLRAALVLSGIGIAVVAAGELAYQFMRLVKGAGSFGAAVELVRKVAEEAFDKISLKMSTWLADGQAIWADFKADAVDVFGAIVSAGVEFGNRYIGIYRGAFEAVKVIWGALPDALGAAAVGAANAAISAIEGMLKKAAGAIDTLTGSIANSWIGDKLGAIGTNFEASIDLGEVTNSYADKAAQAGADAATAFSEGFNTNTFSDPGNYFSGVSDGLRGQADAYREASGMLAKAASGPMTAWEEMKAAMQDSDEATADATETVSEFGDALDDVEGSSGGATTSIDKTKDAVEKLSDRMKETKETMKTAFTGIITGAKSVKEALADMLQSFADMVLGNAFDGLWSGAESGGGVLSGIGKLLGFANGTPSAPGGLAMVGERGPELVNLPRGSQVVTAENTRQMLSGSGGGLTYAPTIDARGASLEAVNELKATLQADAAQFSAKVEAAYTKAKASRRI
jgi:hypothetical protein